MAKINRFAGNLQAFGSSATGTERTVFGDTVQSDALDDNVNSDFFRGWGIVGVNENPTKQDFNAFAFTATQLLSYIHQMGVPEWQAAQEFHTGSVTQAGGAGYISVSDSNTGNDPEADDGTNWAQAGKLLIQGVAKLRDQAPVSGRLIDLAYHTSVAGGGGGAFWGVTGAAPATYTDDNGWTIVPSGGDGSAAWLRIGEDVSVRDYGALGDGITDDAAAIQAAIGVSANRVYVPAGTYYCGATVYLNNTGQTFIGAGKDSTLLDFADNVNGLSLSKSHINVNNITLRNSGTSTDGSGIFAVGAPNSVITQIHINGFYNAVRVRNSQAFILTDSHMWYFLNYGIYLDGDLNNDYFFARLFINGGARSGGVGTNSHGIRMVDKNDALMFDDLTVIMCNYAMTTDKTTGFGPSFCRFNSVFFDSCTNGVLLDKTDDFSFSNCWFSNRPANGIDIHNSESTLFTGCTFSNSGGHGCLVDSACINTKFIGCKFISNGSVGSRSGLVISSNTEQFVISGCEFSNGLRLTSYQDVGLTINSGCDFYSITDNIAKTNNTTQMINSSTPAEGYWSNNIGYRTENHKTEGVVFDASGLGSFSHGLSATPTYVSAELLNGGGAETQILSITSSVVNVRNRVSSTNANATGSYNVIWKTEV